MLLVITSLPPRLSELSRITSCRVGYLLHTRYGKLKPWLWGSLPESVNQRMCTSHPKLQSTITKQKASARLPTVNFPITAKATATAFVSRVTAGAAPIFQLGELPGTAQSLRGEPPDDSWQHAQGHRSARAASGSQGATGRLAGGQRRHSPRGGAWQDC